MSVVEDLIVAGNDGSISFGNYELPENAKKGGFEVKGYNPERLCRTLPGMKTDCLSQ